MSKSTLLNAETCSKKGLCPVGKTRSFEPYRLYYEIHGSLDASQRMVFSLSTNLVWYLRLIYFLMVGLTPLRGYELLVPNESSSWIVMGLNNTCEGWSDQVDYFGSKPDHQVLVFDNRGVGNSEDGLPGFYKTSEMAQDVVDLLEFVGWTQDRSLHLIGVSMGGMIAQELCLIIPKRFKSVALVSTKSGEQRGFPPFGLIYLVTRVVTKTISVEQRVEYLIDALFPANYLKERISDTETRRDHFRKRFLRRYSTTGQQSPTGMIGQLGAVLTHCCPASSLQKISQDIKPGKVSVLGGELDKLVSPKVMRQLHAGLDDAQLVLMKDVGHALNAQDPKGFNELLEKLMSESNQAFM